MLKAFLISYNIKSFGKYEMQNKHGIFTAGIYGILNMFRCVITLCSETDYSSSNEMFPFRQKLQGLYFN